MCQALCISHIISLSHHNSSEKWVLSYMIADCPTCYVGREGGAVRVRNREEQDSDWEGRPPQEVRRPER